MRRQFESEVFSTIVTFYFSILIFFLSQIEYLEESRRQEETCCYSDFSEKIPY